MHSRRPRCAGHTWVLVRKDHTCLAAAGPAHPGLTLLGVCTWEDKAWGASPPAPSAASLTPVESSLSSLPNLKPIRGAETIPLASIRAPAPRHVP